MPRVATVQSFVAGAGVASVHALSCTVPAAQPVSAGGSRALLAKLRSPDSPLSFRPPILPSDGPLEFNPTTQMQSESKAKQGRGDIIWTPGRG